MTPTRRTHPALHALALAILLAAGTPAQAQSNGHYFMKYDDVQGSAMFQFHREWIELNSFDWGVSVTPPTHASGGSTLSFEDFSWNQALDKSVTGLFSDITRGTHAARVDIDFTTQSDRQRYFRMRFDDVLLTGLQLTGADGIVPTLDGSFSYGRVQMEYWTFNAAGNATGSTTAFYDLRTRQGDLAALLGVYALGVNGPSTAPVPEPASGALLLAGLAGIGLLSRRRSNG